MWSLGFKVEGLEEKSKVQGLGSREEELGLGLQLQGLKTAGLFMLIQCGCQSDVFVGSSLVDMYAKCGTVEDVSRVFNRIPSRDVVTWNTTILGHVKCREGQKALELF